MPGSRQLLFRRSLKQCVDHEAPTGSLRGGRRCSSRRASSAGACARGLCAALINFEILWDVPCWPVSVVRGGVHLLRQDAGSSMGFHLADLEMQVSFFMQSRGRREWVGLCRCDQLFANESGVLARLSHHEFWSQPPWASIG